MKLLLNEIGREEWQHLADTALAPMQQRWAYGDAVTAMGRRVDRIEIRDGDRTIALAQTIRRRILVPLTLVSRGPVWLGDIDADRRAHAVATMRRELPGLLALTPPGGTGERPATMPGFRQVMTPTTVAILTLGEALRDRMHGKWRNRLSFAERAGLTIRQSPQDRRAWGWLFRADARQQKARRYRALPAAFTENWPDRDRDRVTMWTAHRDAEPIAAMLFLRHGNTATYHIGWTSEQGRAASAHHLILTRAAEALAAQGVVQMDLGSIDTETAPGLARFKLGTGARAVRTGGTWLGW